MKQLYHFIGSLAKTYPCCLRCWLTAYSAVYARQFRIDSSVEHLYATNVPIKKYYEKVRALFGNDDITVIGGHRKTCTPLPPWRKCRRISKQIEKIDGVRACGASLMSLTRSPILQLPPLSIPHIPTEPSASRRYDRRSRSSTRSFEPGHQRRKGCSIVVYFKPLSDAESSTKKGDDQLQTHCRVVSKDRNSLSFHRHAEY